MLVIPPDYSTIAVIVGALITAIGVITAAFVSRGIGKNRKILKEQAQQLAEIHVLVNSRLSNALEEIQSLKELLLREGGVVPAPPGGETKAHSDLREAKNVHATTDRSSPSQSADA